MTWKKGQSGNPYGLDSASVRRLRAIEGLAPAAINRLRVLIDSDDKQIALAACKEVLSRVVPVPKTPLVALQVNQNSSPHLEALKALTMLPGRLSTYNSNAVPEKVPELIGQVSDNIKQSTYDVVKQIDANTDESDT